MLQSRYIHQKSVDWLEQECYIVTVNTIIDGYDGPDKEAEMAYPNPNLIERQAREYRAERLREAELDRLARQARPAVAGALRRGWAYAAAGLLIAGGFLWGLW
jgi:hypothetical protein